MKKTIIPAVIGSIMLLIGEVRAPPQFSGKVWRDIYGTAADSADVIITNKNGIDTVMTKVSRGGTPAYWAKAAPDEWNLQLGDTVRVKAIDIDGDSAKTFRDVTSATGANLVIDLFTENVYNTHKGHSLLIKKIYDTGIDSVNAKCWVKGKPDTLTGRFRINTSMYNIAFNAENFPTASKPQFGDSIFFKMTTASHEATSKGVYLNQFIDGDTFPSCSLKLVGVTEEQLENKVKETGKLIITPNPTTNYVTFGKQFRGFLYDASGKLVSNIEAEKLDLKNLTSGVYFIIDDKKKNKEKIIYVK